MLGKRVERELVHELLAHLHHERNGQLLLVRVPLRQKILEGRILFGELRSELSFRLVHRRLVDRIGNARIEPLRKLARRQELDLLCLLGSGLLLKRAANPSLELCNRSASGNGGGHP